MNFRGIDHIGVTVPDLDAATAFFTRLLRAEVLYDTLPPDQGPRGGPATDPRLGTPAATHQTAVRMLRLPGGPGLELFEFCGPRQREPAVPCDLGWQHLAWYVEDVEEAMDAVRAAGGTVLGPPQPLPGPEAGPRNRFVYCLTPWSSTFELLSYPDPQPYQRHTPLRRWSPAATDGGD